MRRALLLIVLAGCSRPPEPPSRDGSDFRVGSYALALGELQLLKAMRDAERYENARMYEHAENEYWCAELLGFGLPGRKSTARLARNRRIGLRDRLRAEANLVATTKRLEGTSEICRLRISQEQIEITKHVRDGERAAAQGRDLDADREFAAAERKILALPGQDKSMVDLLPHLRESRARVQPGRCHSP